MLRRLSWPLVFVASLVIVSALARPPQRFSQQVHMPPLLPRVEVVRVLAAPLLHLATDYYWIQTIQAVGIAATPEEYRDIYDYADLVTDLDPSFRQVYPFVGAVIPVARWDGGWANTEESTRILEKGLKHDPKNIYLRILLSYNLTVFQKDFQKAAKLLEETSRLPGAPSHVAGLATRLYAQAGDFDAGLALASSLAGSAEQPEVRELFERRVLEVQLERLLEQVDAAAAAYQKREGRVPPNLQVLVAAGDLPGMPEDPLGGEILLDATGRARSSAQEKRLTDTVRMQLQEVSP
jgi:hypothetical protein